MPTTHESLSSQQHQHSSSSSTLLPPIIAALSQTYSDPNNSGSSSSSISEANPISNHHRTTEALINQHTTSDPHSSTDFAEQSGRHIVFSRQIAQRSMPDELVNVPVSRHSLASTTSEASNESQASSRRDTLRHSRPPISPTTDSKTPLTPEESPPYRSTRKRTASNVEQDEQDYRSIGPSPTHSRGDSGDRTAQVCICQPDPKIPRPRNAFILYRQHHQAKVIAEHPGLANPEISKIIGEQWRNQPPDVKNEWKQLAEEEKVRHQQQYPTYRYQPRRNTRRNSLTDTITAAPTNEKAVCPKCGGRTVLATSNYSTASGLHSSPTSSSFASATPTSSTTPISRTLPVLGDLSLQSPATRRMGQPRPGPEMSPRHVDERDDGSGSPEAKRRRYNNDQPVIMYRAVPPRYSVAGTPIDPRTPFPFSQAPSHHHHPYTTASAAPPPHSRRESLPSLRMMSPPGPMGPPPRPGMGYQQHRLSQGHTPDRSLTLPPLQTGNHASASAPRQESKSAVEIIMSMPLSEKLEVLRRIAPPAKITRVSNRGPLIAIEGDDVAAVHSLAQWLVDTLDKEEELKVRLLDAPDVKAIGDDDSAMAEYHMLAAKWLETSKSLINELTYALPTPPSTAKSSMSIEQAGTSPKSQMVKKTDTPQNTDRDDVSMTGGSEAGGEEQTQAETQTHSTMPAITTQQKPVLVVPAFSLHATNVFACRIPITDVYSPREHWQWSATLWRGIIGPDLTIYIRDADASDNGRPVQQSESERLFVVKRNKQDAGEGAGIESSTLRRVGFEVSEWVRAHASRRRE